MKPSLTHQATYRAGLLQSQAYRALTQFMNSALDPMDISLPEWSVIGLLVTKDQEWRAADIATELAIKQPVATRLLNGLEAKGIIKRQPDRSDRRATHIVLTTKGTTLAERIETDLRQVMRDWLSDVTAANLAIYLKVMEQIANKI